MTVDIAKPEFTTLAAEIVALTQICQGVIPADSAALWVELATLRNIAPSSDALANARNVLESFGEPWDDDYEDDDGKPSLAALEAVHALVQKTYGDGSSDVEPAEDDDEDEIAAQEKDI